MRHQWKSRIDLWKTGILDKKPLPMAIPRGDEEVVAAWKTITVHFQVRKS
jgi:hypothetical protein